MQQKTKIALISTAVGIPLLGYMFYRYALANYNLKPVGGSIVKLDYPNNILDLNLVFELKSTIGIGFIVEDIELDVSLQGIKVGHISKQDKINVPSNGTTNVSIPLNIDLAPIKSNILGLVTSALNGIDITIDGYSKAYISGIPLGIKVNVNEVINVL